MLSGLWTGARPLSVPATRHTRLARGRRQTPSPSPHAEAQSRTLMLSFRQFIIEANLVDVLDK